ncbi:hypothetical protein [Streptomyces genisteinicus]|uniref:Uncharacterized protein n=1 Tax=Streptomyces genisteinicus TaxID=2768068 RepID=A0A7H0HWY3_9ACTN|nr:hypothetical protein [Streptomyces genisteinicus]QNP65049.1 hypothetical protein IAG43_20425 [Streptomyces genisteinicus]
MTTTPDVQLVRDLVAQVPGFEEMYESHMFDQDGVLPHVFFWDVVQETVRSYLGQDPEAPDWRRTLDFLDERLALGVKEADAVIVTSFLNDLPFPGEPGHDIVRSLGPHLAAAFARIRPAG